MRRMTRTILVRFENFLASCREIIAFKTRGAKGYEGADLSASPLAPHRRIFEGPTRRALLLNGFRKPYGFLRTSIAPIG